MKLFSKSDFAAILMILFLSIFALKSLAIPGFYTSHDGVTHTARIAQYYQALKDGQFPPRWAGTLNKDFGSPIFVYIYPMPYLLGSALHSIGLSFTDSFEVLMALTFIFSGIFSYMWLKEIWQSTDAALIGALFYTWVPYRFVLLYVRASISESVAYTFIPLVFWSLTKLSSKNNLKWLSMSSFSIGFLLLSQNLVALISLPVLVAFTLTLGFSKKSIKPILLFLVALIWAFSIAAMTYLPSLFERHFIRFDDSFRLAYQDQFVTLTQLIHSPWGYGFSFGGTDPDGMSFQLGLAHILIFVLTLATLTVLGIIKVLPKFKTRIQKHLLYYISISKDQFRLTILFLVIFCISIVLMLDIAPTKFTWDLFKKINIVDFPWRILGISALASAFLASFIAKIFRPRLILIILIVAALIANRNHLRINLPDYYYDDFFSSYNRDSATQRSEFTPVTRPSARFEYTSRVEVLDDDLVIFNEFQKSNLVSFTTESKDNSRIRVNTLYFPGWEVFIDGIKLKKDKDYLVTSDTPNQIQDPNTLGVFEVNIPQGRHEVLLKFTETPLRNLANSITLSALLIVLLTMFYSGNSSLIISRLRLKFRLQRK